MRVLGLALALAACGQNPAPHTAPADTATPAPAHASATDLSGPLIAVGEDFRLEALPEQDAVVLHYIPEDSTVSGPYVAPVATAAGAELHSNDIALTLTPGACAMNGVTYPLHASVTITNARVSEGCAFVRWDRDLRALLPRIDACIARSPQTRRITYAGYTGEAVVTVRMEGNGAKVDCTIPNDATESRYAIVAPRRNELQIAGEGEAIFVRAPGENPGGDCFQAAEVRDANGELLGWMDDPLGC